MTLRIGLIGAARVATYAMIPPASSVDNVELVGIAARDAARAERYAAEHGIARAYGSYAALIADPDIDLVYIATPPAEHTAIALAAVAAGKHVLVEKPFAMLAAEAREVLAAADAAGVRVFEAMHSPHHGLFARLMEIVRSGEIGDVRSLDAEFSTLIAADDPIRWNAGLGGGALMDLGVYPLAWARRLAGETFDILRTQADMRDDVDAAFEAELSFAGDVQVVIRSSMLTPISRARLIIEGQEGRIDVINPLSPQIGNLVKIDGKQGARSETFDGPTSFEAQLAAIRDTLIDGAEFPFSRDDFVHSMAALNRIRADFGR